MKRFFLLSVVLTMFLGSCTNNSDIGVVPIGPEKYIPASVQEYFAQHNIDENVYAEVKYFYDEATNYQFPFPTGVIAPNLEGQFVMDPYQCVYASQPEYIGATMSKRTLYMYNQHNGFCSYYSKQGQTLSYSDTICIMGEENRFMAFYVDIVDGSLNLSGQGCNIQLEDGSLQHIEEYPYYVKTLIVFTGERVPNAGMINCFFIRYILDKIDPGYITSDGIELNVAKPIGNIEITTDVDGVTEEYEWYEAN